MFKTITDEYKIQPEKVVFFAADGASSMMGCHTGAAERLRELLGGYHLVRVHCLAHRLELCSKAAFQDNQVYTTFEPMLQRAVSSLRQSPRRQARLEELANELGIRSRRIPAFAPTRWLSRSASLAVLVDEYMALCLLFKLEFDRDLYDYFARASTFLIARAFSDLADIVATFCRQLQAQDLTAGELFLHLTHILTTLEQVQQAGPRASPAMACFRQGLALVLQQGTIHLYNMEEEVSLRPLEEGDAEKLDVTVRSLAGALRENITSRFRDVASHKALRILDPRFIPTMKTADDERVHEYGRDIFRLLSTLQERGVEQVTLDDCVNVVRTLIAVQTTLQGAGVPNAEELRRYHSQVYHNGKEGRIVKLLFNYHAAVQLTSVDCERMFSAMNLIKTDLRSRLTTEVLDDLLVAKVVAEQPLNATTGIIVEDIAAKFVGMRNRRLV